MPAGAQWSWIEAYGLLRADPDAVHGTDWSAAVGSAAAGLDTLLGGIDLDAELAAAADWIDAAPERVLQVGSGWGALQRRLQTGWPSMPGTPFPDQSLGDEQAPWLELLRTGRMSADSPETPPVAYQVHAEWAERLDGVAGWLPRLQLGVIRASSGDLDGARAAWLASVEAQPTAWVSRNLGRLALHQGALDEAIAHHRAAHALAPDLLPLTLELLDVLLRENLAAEALCVIAALTPEQRSAARIRLAAARASLAVGDLDRCGAQLDSTLEVPNVREGEQTLDRLWFDYQAARVAAAEGVPVDAGVRQRAACKYPLPFAYDFRMLDAPAPH